jgi:hypothetical protein
MICWRDVARDNMRSLFQLDAMGYSAWRLRP